MAMPGRFVLLVYVATVAADPPIPRGGYDGYWLGSAKPTAAHLEMFGDLICPDTKKAFPTSKLPPILCYTCTVRHPLSSS
jgi:hypothetical protein